MKRAHAETELLVLVAVLAVLALAAGKAFGQGIPQTTVAS